MLRDHAVRASFVEVSRFSLAIANQPRWKDQQSRPTLVDQFVPDKILVVFLATNDFVRVSVDHDLGAARA